MNWSFLTFRCTPITLAALLALGLPSVARSQPSVSSGDGEEQSTTNPAASVEDYRHALAQAATPEEQVELSLGLARALTEEIALTIEETEKLYTVAVAHATGAQILPARNAYGVFLLRLSRFEQAADVFAEGLAAARDAQSDPVARSRFLFNYATALENSGRPTEASPIYRESLILVPGFRSASAALVRVSSALPRPQAARAWSDLIDLLLDQGDLEGVVLYMRDRWERDEAWTLAYARYLTELDLSPQNYPPVDFYRDLTGCEEWYPETFCARVSLINQAFSRDQLSLLLIPEEGKAFTQPWQTTSESAHAFSNLLKSIGDAFAREGNPTAALSRYALAWSSDLNLEAAVSLASLLLWSGVQVDPDGRVLDHLTSAVLQGEGDAYRQGDWENIIRFHSILAELFERQGRWGSSANPRSAVFQLEHALKAQHHLAASPPPEKKLELLPLLHARLANAYSRSSQKRKALDQYLIAAEQFVEMGRPEAAAVPLLRAEELATLGGDAALERLTLFQQKVSEERLRFLASAESKDEIAITGRIRSILSGDPETLPGSVLSTISQDVITLSGEVSSRTKSAEIEKLVRADMRVSVRNEIRVATAPSIPNNSFAERTLPTNLRYSIVIDKFESKSESPRRLEDEWTSLLVSALHESGHFIVVAESDVQLQALKEHLMGAFGMTTQGRDKAVRGLMTPAQLLVRGAISFKEREANRRGVIVGIGGIRRALGRKKTEIRADVQIIDATTGALVAAKNFIGDQESSNPERTVRLSEDDNVHEAFEKVLAEVIPWLVAQLPSVPWRGSVVKVTGERVIINRGSREGVTSGDEFIAGESEILSNPETGETLDEIVHERARIQVVQVGERISVCSVVNGDADQIVEGMSIQYHRGKSPKGQG